MRFSGLSSMSTTIYLMRFFAPSHGNFNYTQVFLILHVIIAIWSLHHNTTVCYVRHSMPSTEVAFDPTIAISKWFLEFIHLGSQDILLKLKLRFMRCYLDRPWTILTKHSFSSVSFMTRNWIEIWAMSSNCSWIFTSKNDFIRLTLDAGEKEMQGEKVARRTLVHKG